MESLLLQEMSNADIDWFQYVGTVQELMPNQVLMQPDSPDHQVHLLLQGGLTIAFPAQETLTPQELMPLDRGDLIGEVPALEPFYGTATIHARTPCQILSIDQHHLAEKLAQDTLFAAHFYRVQALLIMQRLQTLMFQFQLNPDSLYQINVKEASSLFAELQDSDLDWFIAVGEWQSLPRAAILQPADRPIEALYFVLEGALSLGASRESPHDLAQIFYPRPQDTASAPLQELTRIARGDIFGEMPFAQVNAVTMPLSRVQVQAVRDTEVLSIPRWRLISKLLHDPGFAFRFYRVLAVLLASKYHTLVTHLGFITQPNPQGLGSSDRLLTQMARAEKRFEWMVQRIQTKIATRGDMQW